MRSRKKHWWCNNNNSPFTSSSSSLSTSTTATMTTSTNSLFTLSPLMHLPNLTSVMKITILLFTFLLSSNFVPFCVPYSDFPDQNPLLSCNRTRKVITNTSWGIITDGKDNYTQDSYCEWLIVAEPNHYINLEIVQVRTECSYDYVFVFDGESYTRNTTLLASFSGASEHHSVTLLARSGKMLILLYSDTNYALEGFHAEFSITRCPLNCSSLQGAGKCVQSSTSSSSSSSLFLDSTDVESITESENINSDSEKMTDEQSDINKNINSNSNNNDIDDNNNNNKYVCKCNPSYTGEGCEIKNKEYDTLLIPSKTFPNLYHRVGHSACRIHGKIYIFGGFDLNRILNDLKIYDLHTGQIHDFHPIFNNNNNNNNNDNHHHNSNNNNNSKNIKKNLKSRKKNFKKYPQSKEDSEFLKVNANYNNDEDLEIEDPDDIDNMDSTSNPTIFTFGVDSDENEMRVTEGWFWPRGRFGHSSTCYKDGFFIHGGRLSGGPSAGISNELLYFNVTTMSWIKVSGDDNNLNHNNNNNNDSFNSESDPNFESSSSSSSSETDSESQGIFPKLPALMYHTMTLGPNDEIYVYGGGTISGSFSWKLYRFQADQALYSPWEEVSSSCCGKLKDRSVLGHATQYWSSQNALIVFGGVTVDIGRFSKISSSMWMYFLDSRVWMEIEYRKNLQNSYMMHYNYKSSGSNSGGSSSSGGAGSGSSGNSGNTNSGGSSSNSILSKESTERAFHSMDIVGNTLLIIGGYTHSHNKDETCYSNQMLVYNLECHIFIPDLIPFRISGIEQGHGHKIQGVFGQKTVIYKEKVYIIGGYRGYLDGRIRSISLPFKSHKNEGDCLYYDKWSCTTNVACGWCPIDGRCYEKYSGSKNCTTNLQTSSCPGICPLLTSCQSCVISGCRWCDLLDTCLPQGDDLMLHDTRRQCHSAPLSTDISSCVRNFDRQGVTLFEYRHPADLQNPDNVKLVNSTVFRLPRDTSHINSGSASSSSSSTSSSSSSSSSSSNSGIIGGGVDHGVGVGPTVWVMKGFLVGIIQNPGRVELCGSQARINLTMDNESYQYNNVNLNHRATSTTTRNRSKGQEHTMENLTTHLGYSVHLNCMNLTWPSGAPVMLQPDTRIRFEISTNVSSATSSSSFETPVRVILQQRMAAQVKNSSSSSSSTSSSSHSVPLTPYRISKESLIPYSSGSNLTCLEYTSCLACLGDSACAFLNGHCRSRHSIGTLLDEAELRRSSLVLTLDQCPVCSDQTTCRDCLNFRVSGIQGRYHEQHQQHHYHGNKELVISSSSSSNDDPDFESESTDSNSNSNVDGGLFWPSASVSSSVSTSSVISPSSPCEWSEEDSSCHRRGRMDNSIREATTCPIDCHMRKNCSSCLEGPGRCVWCADKQECFVFDVYTSFFQYGQCIHWMDKSEMCQRCARLTKCGDCIKNLGCGWNYNENGGNCVEGDFSGPLSPTDELVVMSSSSNSSSNNNSKTASTTTTTTTTTKWTYDQCPDIDECTLGIHDCHPNATCINTPGSFTCVCKQAFTGDGRKACDQTCYHPCVHGTCSSSFVCECDLGWTGVDCSIDCGCNNRSSCETGKCDKCQDYTEGEHCELCVKGSYGDARSSSGCTPCNCNGHGNIDGEGGECDSVTGECHCLHNTVGRDCSRCNENEGYFGDPRNGQPCYRSCSGRALMDSDEGMGYFGLNSRMERLRRKKMNKKKKQKMEDSHIVEHCMWILRLPKKQNEKLKDDDGDNENENLQQQPTINSNLNSPRKIKIIISPNFYIPCSENSLNIYSGLPSFAYNTNRKKSVLIASVCSPEEDDDEEGEAEAIELSPLSRSSTSATGRTLSSNSNFYKKSILNPKPKMISPSSSSNLYRSRQKREGKPLEIFVDSELATIVLRSVTNSSKIRFNGTYQFHFLNINAKIDGENIHPNSSPSEDGNGNENNESHKDRTQIYPSNLPSSLSSSSSILTFTLQNSRIPGTRLYDGQSYNLGFFSRFGHSLHLLDDKNVWIFGGYSLAHGALNDVRKFNRESGKWEALTIELNFVDNEEEDSGLPPPRYFHAGAVVPANIQNVNDYVIIIHGGLTEKAHFLSDTWRFDTRVKRWSRIARGSSSSSSSGSTSSGSSSSSSSSSRETISGSSNTGSGGSSIYGAVPSHALKLAGHTLTVRSRNPNWNKNRKNPDPQQQQQPQQQLNFDYNIILIGGMNSETGFSNRTFNLNLRTGEWEEVNTVGSNPIGIYGHSTVYHEGTDTFYVFGGILFEAGKVSVSSTIFALRWPTKRWTVIPPMEENQVHKLPVPRFLHTAVSTDSYMIVIGGTPSETTSTEGGTSSTINPSMMAYAYKCNLWTLLASSSSSSSSSSPSSLSSTSSSSVENDVESFLERSGTAGGIWADDLLLMGGWDWRGATTSESIFKLKLPKDICSVQSSSESCKATLGCSYCFSNNNQSQQCYNAELDMPRECSLRPNNTELKIDFLGGTVCSQQWLESRNCNQYLTCTECLASYPSHSSASPACQWCTNCEVGRCIELGKKCPKENSCSQKQRETLEVSHCPERACSASECDKCTQIGIGSSKSSTTTNGNSSTSNSIGNNQCFWTRQILRSGEYSWKLASQPIYDWNCIRKQIVNTSTTSYKVAASPPESCPLPCSSYKSCSKCLSSTGGEGGFQSCRWSVSRSLCISPAHSHLLCFGGTCGPILHGGAEVCPAPCIEAKSCSECLRDPSCGWCAATASDKNGEGQCLPGDSISSSIINCTNIIPASFSSSSSGSNSNTFAVSSSPVSWNYESCPAENECLNSHHNCDQFSEKCIDLEVGFRCECKDGYRKEGGNDDSGSGVGTDAECVPICEQGCVHGSCVAPNECSCHFGYVGVNCSKMCNCNGHSTCADDDLDNCTQCLNNTMGPQCSKCKPLFVGDPRAGRPCISCYDYCNGHSNVCLPLESFSLLCSSSSTGTGLGNHNHLDGMESKYSSSANSNNNNLNVNINPDELYARIRNGNISIVKEGATGEAFCCGCKDMTTGTKCEDCVKSHFRGSEDKRKNCRKCECSGHGNECDPITGTDCNCNNNTESEHCSPNSGKGNQCWKSQCAKCRDSYLGTPSNGKQCYRHMFIDNEYCFDPKSQEYCTTKPKPLLAGRTVFFAVQPKFMNVNIRFNLDVSHGAVHVYLSPKDDTFVIRPDNNTWMHHVDFEGKYSLNGEREGTMSNMNLNQIHDSGGKDSTDSSSNPQSNLSHGNDDMSPGPSKVSGPSRFRIIEEEAAGFATHITLHEPRAILIVKNVRNRLVITLPQDYHDLRLTRFYIVLEGVGDVSNGSVFFSQYQLHIDLFVFFSVFFSAFFLFLAACGIAWKVKSNMEARRARHRHVAEMLSMAKRPFAVFTVLLEPEQSSPLYQAYTQCRKSCRKGCICIRPMAIESTHDGQSGVVTMLISLPGTPSNPVKLCLGSTLGHLTQRHPPIHARRRRR